MHLNPLRKVEKAEEGKTSPVKSIDIASIIPSTRSAPGDSIILAEDNYALWANNCRMRLRAASLLHVIEGGPCTPEEKLQAHMAIMAPV